MMHNDDRTNEDEQPLGARRAQLRTFLSETTEEKVDRENFAPHPNTSTHSPYRPRHAYSAARSIGQTTYNPEDALKPLIDQVSNHWQDEKLISSSPNSEYGDDEDRQLHFCDCEDDDSCPNVTQDLLASRRFRRLMAILVSLLLVAYGVWHVWIRPGFEREWELKRGFMIQRNGTYGLAQGGDFDGQRVQDLSEELLPGGVADPDAARRLVFVGDIHGCADELKSLFRKIGLNEKTDHVVAVGDVVSKGPANVEVLDELIRMNASSVRGNHEDRLLTMAPTVLNSKLPPPTEESTSKGFAKDAALLRQLSRKHVKYLQNMPLMLRIPPLPLTKSAESDGNSTISQEILVVHAGLVPAVPLDRQDPYFVMNMRSIHIKSHLPSASARRKNDRNEPWHELWEWYNNRLFRVKSLAGFVDFGLHSQLAKDEAGWFGSIRRLLGANRRLRPQPQVVIYGHHSKAGLVVREWSKGLDTGCVAGGRLTALVLDAQGRYEVVSVDCEGHGI